MREDSAGIFCLYGIIQTEPCCAHAQQPQAVEAGCRAGSRCNMISQPVARDKEITLQCMHRGARETNCGINEGF